MSTAASILATRVTAALRTASVATQAGIAAGTWSSSTVPRVFRGIGGLFGGRNMGRLPFIEFDIEGQTFAHRYVEGGDLTQRVHIRVHVGGGDISLAGEKCEAILCAGMAQIRSEVTDNLVALGDDEIQAADNGPWGAQRDAFVSVTQSFERSDYEVQ